MAGVEIIRVKKGISFLATQRVGIVWPKGRRRERLRSSDSQTCESAILVCEQTRIVIEDVIRKAIGDKFVRKLKCAALNHSSHPHAHILRLSKELQRLPPPL